MGIKTISSLDDVGTAKLTDLHEIVDTEDFIDSPNGTSKRTSNQQLFDLFNANAKRQIISLTADYTIESTDIGKIFLCDSNTFEITLPNYQIGFYFTVKNVKSFTDYVGIDDTVTISAPGLTEYGGNLVLTRNQSVTLLAVDNTNKWVVIDAANEGGSLTNVYEENELDVISNLILTKKYNNAFVTIADPAGNSSAFRNITLPGPDVEIIPAGFQTHIYNQSAMTSIGISPGTNVSIKGSLTVPPLSHAMIIKSNESSNIWVVNTYSDQRPIVNLTGSYAVTPQDNKKVFICSQSLSITIQIPFYDNVGFYITIKYVKSGNFNDYNPNNYIDINVNNLIGYEGNNFISLAANQAVTLIATENGWTVIEAVNGGGSLTNFYYLSGNSLVLSPNFNRALLIVEGSSINNKVMNLSTNSMQKGFQTYIYNRSNNYIEFQGGSIFDREPIMPPLSHAMLTKIDNTEWILEVTANFEQRRVRSVTNNYNVTWQDHNRVLLCVNAVTINMEIPLSGNQDGCFYFTVKYIDAYPPGDFVRIQSSYLTEYNGMVSLSHNQSVTLIAVNNKLIVIEAANDGGSLTNIYEESASNLTLSARYNRAFITMGGGTPGPKIINLIEPNNSDRTRKGFQTTIYNSSATDFITIQANPPQVIGSLIIPPLSYATFIKNYFGFNSQGDSWIVKTSAGSSCTGKTALSALPLFLPDSSSNAPQSIKISGSNLRALVFPHTGGASYAYAQTILPKSVDKSSFSCRIFWQSATAGAVVWNMQAALHLFGYDINNNPSYGAVATVSSLCAANSINNGSTESLMTVVPSVPQSSPFPPSAEEVLLEICLYRDGADINDTLTDFANIIGIQLYFNKIAGNDE